MNSEHTPGPWKTYHEYVYGVNERALAACNGPNDYADAKRIVACVNALDGFDPSAVPDVVQVLRTCVEHFRRQEMRSLRGLSTDNHAANKHVQRVLAALEGK